MVPVLVRKPQSPLTSRHPTLPTVCTGRRKRVGDNLCIGEAVNCVENCAVLYMARRCGDFSFIKEIILVDNGKNKKIVCKTTEQTVN